MLMPLADSAALLPATGDDSSSRSAKRARQPRSWHRCAHTSFSSHRWSMPDTKPHAHNPIRSCCAEDNPFLHTPSLRHVPLCFSKPHNVCTVPRQARPDSAWEPLSSPSHHNRRRACFVTVCLHKQNLITTLMRQAGTPKVGQSAGTFKVSRSLTKTPVCS
jgi:hypothetical protein